MPQQAQSHRKPLSGARNDDPFRAYFDQHSQPTVAADWSGVKQAIDQLQDQGVTDLKAHFSAHPCDVSRLRGLICNRILNTALLEFYGADTPQTFERYVAREVGAIDRFEIYSGVFCAFHAGRTSYECEGREIAANGTTLTTRTRFQLMPGCQQDWRHVFVTIEDISDQVRLGAFARHTRRGKRVKTVSGGVAHEFNNLLSIIQGCTELLDATSNQDHDMVAHISDAVRRGSDITHKLLAYARAQTLTPRKTDLRQVIDAARDRLHQSQTWPGTVLYQPPVGLWPCRLDRRWAEKTLLELLINAVEAMPHGGRLHLTCENQTLDAKTAEIEGVPPGAYVRLRVMDTGQGLSDTVMLQAFDPFFTTKDVGQGLGLGLSAVQGFVRQSGGHISLLSAPGSGTRVTLFFPRDPGAT